MIVTEACEMRLPDHREAMILAANEYARFLDLLQDLAPDDWARPTDCTLWDVRAVVAPQPRQLEANASLQVMAHQFRVASKRAKANGQSDDRRNDRTPGGRARRSDTDRTG